MKQFIIVALISLIMPLTIMFTACCNQRALSNSKYIMYHDCKITWKQYNEFKEIENKWLSLYCEGKLTFEQYESLLQTEKDLLKIAHIGNK